MLNSFKCSNYLCCICIYENFARYSYLGLYALNCLCIFVENDYLTGLKSFCRDDLRICRKLANLVRLGFICWLRSNNLLALLIGCYCVLKLGSTLDLLCLCRINCKSIYTLINLFCRLSLKSLCRVGLFCNCVYTGLGCYSSLFNYRYYLFTGMESLLNLFLCRHRCDILLYYNAVFINSLFDRCSLSCFLNECVSALRLICLESSALNNPCGRGFFYNRSLCLKRYCRSRFFGESRFRRSLGSLFGLNDRGCVLIKNNIHKLRLNSFVCWSNLCYSFVYRSSLCHSLVCRSYVTCNLNSRVSMFNNYVRLVCALTGDLLGFLDVFG